MNRIVKLIYRAIFLNHQFLINHYVKRYIYTIKAAERGFYPIELVRIIIEWIVKFSHD